METYMSMRRQIKRDAKRIEQIKRDRIGRYTKKEKQYQEMFRNIQMVFAVLFLLAFGFIIVKPIEMHNPVVGIETIHAEEKPAMLIIPIDQADQTDRRIEECWAKGHTPGVMAKGFQCVAPAVEVSVK